MTRLQPHEQAELKRHLHDMIDAWEITDFDLRSVTREVKYRDQRGDTITEVDTGVRIIRLFACTRPDPEVRVMPVGSTSVDDDAFAFEFEDDLEFGGDGENGSGSRAMPTRNDALVLSGVQASDADATRVGSAVIRAWVVALLGAAVSFFDRAMGRIMSVVLSQRSPRA